MRRFWLILAFIVILAIAGGLVFLATYDMPPPTTRVEKVIPNDRFLK
jgi:hypothetical protein